MRFIRRGVLWWCLSAVGPVACGGAPAERTATAASEPAARALERRLLAPCCWQGTLDVHASPLVTELRREIRRRLAAGETSQQIEDDLVRRYGPRVRAHLSESLGGWLLVLVGLGGAAALVRFARARPARPAAAAPGASPPPRPASSADADYEAQLDQELLHE